MNTTMNTNLISTNNCKIHCSYCKQAGHRINKCNSSDIDILKMYVLERKIYIDNLYDNLSIDIRKEMLSDWLSQKFIENEKLFEAYAVKCFKFSKNLIIKHKIYFIINKLYDYGISNDIVIDEQNEYENDYIPPIENHQAVGDTISQQIYTDQNQSLDNKTEQITNDKKNPNIIKITCDICYEERDKKKFRQLKICKHVFCTNCIFKLNRCPICREPYNHSHCKSLK